MALGLVLAGVAVLRSRRWSGRHRYLPLVTGAWIVVVLVPVLVLAGDPGTGGAPATIAAWYVLWVALGVAVLREVGAAAPDAGGRMILLAPGLPG